MVRGKDDDLGMDHEAVDAVAGDLARFAEALAGVRSYAHDDDGLTPDKFGPIAARTGVGQNYVQLRDVLRGALDKAAPIVAAMAETLRSSQSRLTEVDSQVAAGIAKADRIR
jgi:hypothetical protein